MKKNIPIFAVCLFSSSLLGQTGVSLLDNSPFMPPGKTGSSQAEDTVANTSLAKLQLRGITSIEGEYIFSVYNPDTRESKWLTQGASIDGLIVKSYDPDRNSVVIHSDSENLSRQMEMNDYSAPTALRANPINRVPTQPTQPRQPTQARPQSPTGTSTIARTQQSVQRPTRRNLETLRARRAELAEKLRKQPKPTDNSQGTTQGNGGQR